MWSTGGIFVKYIQSNPIALSGIRSLFTSIIILAYFKRKVLVKYFPHINYIPAIALMSIAQYAIPYILYCYAIKEVKAVQAVFYNNA